MATKAKAPAESPKTITFDIPENVRTPWFGHNGDLPVQLEYPTGTMYDEVAKMARQYPGHVAFDFMGKKTTYRQMVDKIDKCARESLANFIVKGVTDESWNEYLNTLKNIRLDDYVALYQSVYDRYVEANQ